MIDPSRPDFTTTPASPRQPSFGYHLAEPAAQPLISIVTPFFNTGEIFHETARSVLGQSLQQWEWIIVDDASTDEVALELLDTYRSNDPRIRVVGHTENRGLSAARNTGFRQARAHYVLLLDSDDLIEPTAAEKWYWFLETHPEAAFVKGYTVGFDAQEYLWRRGFHEGRAFLEENLVAPTSLIRRAAWEDAGGFDEENRDGLEDWEFWLRCANHGHWGMTIPEFLDWYRRRPTHADRWPNWTEAGMEAFRGRLRQQYPRLWNGGFPAVRHEHREPNDEPTSRDNFNRLRKEKPRLLLLAPWLEMGGADKFNLDVVTELAARGWETTIATTVEGANSWLPQFAAVTPDVFPLPGFLPIADYPHFLSYLITSRQPDVVLIAHSEFGYRLLPYLRARHPHVAFVDYCHLEEEHWNRGGYARLAVEYRELLDLNVVSSEHLKAWMVERGADPSRIRVCYTNVDGDAWRPDAVARERVRQELHIDASTRVILYLGRLCAQKQPRVFARVMRELIHREGHVIALVAGDGPEENWLREFVAAHRLSDHVRLLGVVSNERIVELMQAADIFFLPSRWEGIALSIYEAMACGLPVVSADVGGQRELVTPACGILLHPADEETETIKYAEVLSSLLADGARRRQMGEAGRARVEADFRLSQMTGRLLATFDEAIRLAADAPRALVPLGLGALAAVQTVEHFRLARQLERFEDAPHGDGSWRARTYHRVRQLLHPYYRRALNREARWVIPVKRTLRRVLLRS